MQNPSSPAHFSSFSAENPNPNPNPSPNSQSSPAKRVWKPAAQRNLRNQWSKLLSHKKDWDSASSKGQSHASSIVNSHLSQRYIPSMSLGVLSKMPEIRAKACTKLAQKQDLHRDQLLSSYKDLVRAVSHMVTASRSMSCFQKGSVGSPLVQFCSHPELINDTGDGGGIPVFSSLSIAHFENLAQELVQMFLSELSLKCITSEEASDGPSDGLSWSSELYPGEFDDMSRIDLLSQESCEPVPPRIKGWKFSSPMIGRPNSLQKREVLQVYLTAWLAEVNIYTNRVDEIFALVGEAMQVNLS